MSPGEDGAPTSQRPLRVLHVINGLALAGAEQVVLSLSRHRGPGVRLDVARLLDMDDLDEPIRALGVPVHALHLRRPAELPGALARLVALVRRVRPDVLHTHLLHAEILGGAVGALLRVPAVVATVHNVMWCGPGHYGRTTRALYRRALVGNDHTVAVIDAVAARLVEAGVPRARVSVIENGIDPPRLLPRAEARRRLGLPEAGLVIGAVGNLNRYKGHDLLVEAVARVAAARPGLPLSLAILGADPDAEGDMPGAWRRALDAQVAARGLSARVRFCGRVADAAAHLSAFDVFAQPSRTEAASVAILEALAAGLPVVATAVGGTPDVVGQSAVLVPAEDPAALAAALGALLDDEAARERLKESALARAARHSAAAMTGAYEALYRTVLDDKGPSARAGSA